MKFRRTVSFNLTDNQIKMLKYRGIVFNGVEDRCTTIVNLFAEEMLVADVGKIRVLLGEKQYTYVEVYYALRLLEKAGVLEPIMSRRVQGQTLIYRMVPRGKLLWLRTRQGIARQEKARKAA